VRFEAKVNLLGEQASCQEQHQNKRIKHRFLTTYFFHIPTAICNHDNTTNDEYIISSPGHVYNPFTSPNLEQHEMEEIKFELARLKRNQARRLHREQVREERLRSRMIKALKRTLGRRARLYDTVMRLPAFPKNLYAFMTMTKMIVEVQYGPKSDNYRTVG
jgi:hypothetical protein